MNKCYCYRCGKIMEANPEVFNYYNLTLSSYKEKFTHLVCDNCIGWYRTGGMNNGQVEYGIMYNKYDKNGVNLPDRFRDEKKVNKKMEDEVKQKKMLSIETHEVNEIEKTIYSPVVIDKTAEGICIHRLLCNDELTRIDFIHYASPIYENGGWVKIERGCFIRPNDSSDKLTLVQAVNIPYAPNKHYYGNKNDFLCYTLYFPPIPKGTKSIDIIESELGGGNWFNFYGVDIEQNNQPKKKFPTYQEVMEQQKRNNPPLNYSKHEEKD